MAKPVKGVEAEAGIAGQPIRPFKPRCLFGRQHLWIMEPLKGRDEAPCQCSRCGAVSSDHPAAQLQDKDTNREDGCP